MKAKKFVMKNSFYGEPKLSDIELVEFDLPTVNNGEILCQAEYLSVDPYMRLLMPGRPKGSDMVGHQVAKILESKNPKFAVGAFVVGRFGWRTHTVVNPETFVDDVRPYILPAVGNLPLSLSLGTVGRPGNTAYFGLLDICDPRPGETVLVTAAAGAVGSHVGQIAKIKGCTVIGFAGTEAKCDWLKNDLKFDHAFNYRSVDVDESIKSAASKGVDCFFDNVGGVVARKIMKHMNPNGRIALCGAISEYNDSSSHDLPVSQIDLIRKNIKVEGFTVGRPSWSKRWLEGIAQNMQWIQEGKLKYVEHVVDGFEKMPAAFIAMMKGENVGKTIVKV